MTKCNWFATGTLLLVAGIVSPINADQKLNTGNFSDELQRQSSGLTLAHFETDRESKTSVVIYPRTEETFSVRIGKNSDLHLGQYRDPRTSGAVPSPEPATLLLLGSGLTGLAALVRRKLNK